MQRRQFTQALGGFTAAATINSLTAGAAQATIAHDGQDPDHVFEAFNGQLPQHPWAQGYEGLQADAADMPLQVRGSVPRELYGSFFRNGPARHSLGGYRYHHFFDGDGMIQKYTLSPQGMVHTGRFVRTAKFLADTAAGHPVSSAFGSNPPLAVEAGSADDINVANTSIMQLGNGEMLALWEGGSATRIDPTSLETLGAKDWRRDLKGLPFSAHPKVEPDGTVWNFGVGSASGKLVLYRISPQGELLQATTLPVPDIAMVHDFAITPRFLVLPLPPLVFDVARARDGATFLDSHVWKPELGLRILVIPKDDPEKMRWFTLPPGFVFHVANAWEGNDGSTVHLDLVRSPDATMVLDGFKRIMRGELSEASQPQLCFITLDLKARQARQEVQNLVGEFPRIDPRVVGQRHRQIYTTLRIAPGMRPGFDAILRFDRESGTRDQYRYGEHVMVEEHLFVPERPASVDGAGWLLGTALDLKQGVMLFSVFDAHKLAAGPIVQGVLPRVMPLGLHGMWRQA